MTTTSPRDAHADRRAAVIALHTAAAIAFVDVLGGLLRSPNTLATLPIFVKAIGTSLLAVLLLYAVTMAVLGPYLTHVIGLHPVRVAVALSAFWFVLILTSILTFGASLPKDGGQWQTFAYLVVVAAGVAAAGLGIAHWLARDARVGAVAAHLLTILVLTLASVSSLLWLHHHTAGMVAMIVLAVASFIFLLGGVVTSGLDPAGRGRRAAVVAAWFVAIAACVAWGSRSGGTTSVSAHALGDRLRVPHVFYVIIDTLRADALSCYSDWGTSTPNLDRFAAESVRFETAVSPAPWTVPGVGSLMTGLSPLVHGATRSGIRVPDTATTLAEHFRDMGYPTAAIGENPHLSPHVANLNQGFDTYAIYPEMPTDTMGDKLIARILHGLRGKVQGVSTRGLTDMAIRWVDEHAAGPFLLWLHYFDPHLPYAPPAKYLEGTKRSAQIGDSFVDMPNIREGHLTLSAEDRTRVRELYLAEVRYVDDQFGRFLDKLKELGIYDDALIVVTSDHGEEFWEHNGFEHGHTLYREVLNVPLIIKTPGGKHRGVVHQPVSTERVMPTILDLCGVDHDADQLSGRTLAQLLADPNAETARGTILSTGLMYYENRISLQFDQYKYIQRLVSGKEELYDLENDPMELDSLIYRRPEVVERARALLAENVQAAMKLKDELGIGDAETIEYDEQTIRQLRSLGYLGD
jgi:arylsulfatase A-like enzyme